MTCAPFEETGIVGIMAIGTVEKMDTCSGVEAKAQETCEHALSAEGDSYRWSSILSTNSCGNMVVGDRTILELSCSIAGSSSSSTQAGMGQEIPQ